MAKYQSTGLMDNLHIDAVMFLWSHSHLTDLGFHHTTVLWISENKYKRMRPEKVEGFPGRIRLAKSMPMRVFLHISDSMINPVPMDYPNTSSTFAENPQCTEYGKTTR